MSAKQVFKISECQIQPQSRPDSSPKRYELSSWDLPMIPIGPIQKGLLFHIPSEVLPQQLNPIIDKLKSSLSIVLSHFLPLSGRLVTETVEDGGLFTFIRCGNEDAGAGFHRAVADKISVADVLNSRYSPTYVRDFFPYNGMINHEGHHLPLLAVQVTELIDGIFLGCTVNHILCDGTSFWNFMRTWSDVVSGKLFFSDDQKGPLLIHNTSSPIKLPFQNLDTLIDKSESSVPDLQDKIFHFSPASIARLKKQVNSEIVTVDIETDNRKNRSITRARCLPKTELVSFKLLCNYRSRLLPPLPPTYFGNCIGAVSTVPIPSGDLLARNLGQTASLLHGIVSSVKDDVIIRKEIDRYVSEPVFFTISGFAKNNGIVMTSSPRFEVYECEFGLGKPVGVLIGGANIYDGKVTSFPGREGHGSMDMVICLSPETMAKLEGDLEFLNFIEVI
ncbi:HXXXD-type acyl-transferase-like protein [Zostera marina]|uniref:HXXXD-type acyl-transferase-like protein n=1 Tax=Zostera marina TaxID=29655 RepID=A0A0K9Q5U3_ZOSMR|nr:HXXXD-type acyl-transferase-like protein [Zostera marina]